MNIDRKEFLVALVGGTATLLVGSCGGGSDYGAMPAAGGGCSASIASNHNHVLTIPAADLNSMVDMTYDIQGSAPHTHSVTFTAAQMAQLKAGTPVTVQTSFTIDHVHSITETCT